MGFQDFNRIGIGAPPVPANNGTAVLFDSTVVFKGGLQMNGIGRIEISFPGLDQASAASGLKGYSSPDGGANWYPFKFGSTVLPATVAAATADDFSAYDIFVGTEKDVKITFTAGATAPTVWKPIITATAGNVHSGT